MPGANDGSQPSIIEALGEALTFHSSFNSETDADFGLGDSKIYSAPSYDELEKAEAGIHNPDIVLAADEGRFGSALRFQKKNETALFYRAENNMTFSNQNWSGTLSFWLRLTPEEDLEPGFCDPIQVTAGAVRGAYSLLQKAPVLYACKLHEQVSSGLGITRDPL